jgi:hypothetical protein
MVTLRYVQSSDVQSNSEADRADTRIRAGEFGHFDRTITRKRAFTIQMAKLWQAWPE